MDSVDKPVPELSPRVTKTPKQPLDTPRTGVNPPENATPGTQSETGAAPNGGTGRDLARAALEAAKAKAKERGTSPGYRRRAANGRLVGRAIAHGVAPRLLDELELPGNVSFVRAERDD